MTSNDIRGLLCQEPFSPFRMELVDGRRVDIRHPELCAVNPASRSMILTIADEGVQPDLNTPLIERISSLKHDQTRGRRLKAG